MTAPLPPTPPKPPPPPDKDWHAAWRDGQIGWHRDHVSPSLIQHAHHLSLPPGGTLLVPLCGASLDMQWARGQGWHVIGVDLSPIAIETFLTRHAIDHRQDGTCYHADQLTLHATDILSLAANELGTVHAIYDRAAMIALHPELRQRYITHLRTLCPPGTPVLTEVLTYDAEMTQPPYSISEDHLTHTLGFASVRLLESWPVDDIPPRLQNTNARAQVFLAQL